MKIFSLIKYIFIEFKNLFIYPSVRKLSSINYEQYWLDRSQNKNLDEFVQDMTPNSFMVQRTQILVNELYKNSNNKEINLFDFGSGDGRQLLDLKNAEINFSNIVASDISQYSLKKLSKYFNTFDLSKNNLSQIKKGKYDVLTAFEVIEHIPNCEEQLLEMYRISNSLVCFSVPNTGFIMHRLRLLLGKFPLQWRSSPSEHVRFWTSSDMYWWLTEIMDFDPNTFKIYHYAGFPLLCKLPFFKSLFCKGILVLIYK